MGGAGAASHPEPGRCTPVSKAETDALLLPLAGYSALILAVSGGTDSMALLEIASGWHRRRSAGRSAGDEAPAAPIPRIIVATVDHGLRAGSAGEAAMVAARAAALGLEHCTLRWNGPKHLAGIQAAARDARYGLLLRLAQELSVAPCGGAGPSRVALITAHTSDDQAETVLMRLMRGSGVDGLAAMPVLGTWQQLGAGGTLVPVDVARPLLGLSRSRLAATLAAAGVVPAEDPSNQDHRFERVRVREALVILEGLGLTRAALARSAARLERARAALEAATDRLEALAVDRVCEVVAALDYDLIAQAPDEIAVRLLRRLLADARGRSGVVASLGAVEELHRRLFREGTAVKRLTIGGAIIETARRDPAESRHLLQIYREPGRGHGLPRVCLGAGDSTLWDGRIWATVARDYPGVVEIGPLGADWAPLRAAHPVLARLPLSAAAARGLPAFRDATGLLAVPMLARWAERQGAADTAAALRGPLVGPTGDAPGATSLTAVALSLGRIFMAGETAPPMPPA